MQQWRLTFGRPFFVGDLAGELLYLYTLWGLVAWNMGPGGLPRVPLYRSGVRYRRERPRKRGQPEPQEWMDALTVYRKRHGDCEDLTAWRVAELRKRGIKARPLIQLRNNGYYHALVQLPDGSLDDPSKRLGMR